MKRLILGALIALSAVPVLAQIAVKDPWVRATVPQQSASGAYMQLTAQKGARLVEVRSPVAATVEIHEMTMDNNIMRMRAISGIDLPAGKTVDIESGGYHIMLMNLKRQIKEGDIVPLTLVVEGGDRKRQLVEVKAPARALNGGARP